MVVAACSAGSGTSDDLDAAAAYCEDTGGTIETRYPYWNTNQDQSAWTQLPGQLELCWYQTLDDEDDSRIYLDLNTLYSETPTLAAAAYLARLPLSGGLGGNPAEVNCKEQLNRAATFGNTLAGGGWVNLDEPTFTVVNLCLFPDGSAIDEWGIAYYTDGTLRGIDLTEVFRFDIQDVPTYFQGCRRDSQAVGWAVRSV